MTITIGTVVSANNIVTTIVRVINILVTTVTFFNILVIVDEVVVEVVVEQVIRSFRTVFGLLVFVEGKVDESIDIGRV